MLQLNAPLTPATGKPGPAGMPVLAPGTQGQAAMPGGTSFLDLALTTIGGNPRQDLAVNGAALPVGAASAIAVLPDMLSAIRARLGEAAPSSEGDASAPATAADPALAAAIARMAAGLPMAAAASRARPQATARGDSAPGSSDTADGDDTRTTASDDAAVIDPSLLAAQILPGLGAMLPAPSAPTPAGSADPAAAPTITPQTALSLTRGVSLGTIANLIDGDATGAGTPPSAAMPVAADGAVAASAANRGGGAMPAPVAAFLDALGASPLASGSATAPHVTPANPALRQAAGAAATAIIPMAVTDGAQPLQPGAVQQAGVLFADALHTATTPNETKTVASGADTLAAIGAANGGAFSPVASASAANHNALDMGQAQWPTRMIERIEMLRDAADANDTRIRLVPDALGAIDVSLKKDGDTMQVHLAAERAETRALIADAQPHLAELGEQRGLRITSSISQSATGRSTTGQSTTSPPAGNPSGGSALAGQPGGQDAAQQRGQPAPRQQPSRPAAARVAQDQSTEDRDRWVA